MAIIRKLSISLGRIIDLILTIPRKLLVFTSYMYVATGYFYAPEIVFYLPKYTFDTGDVALWQAFLSLVFSVELGVISIAIGLKIAWRLPGIRTYFEGSFVKKIHYN